MENSPELQLASSSQCLQTCKTETIGPKRQASNPGRSSNEWKIRLNSTWPVRHNVYKPAKQKLLDRSAKLVIQAETPTNGNSPKIQLASSSQCLKRAKRKYWTEAPSWKHALKSHLMADLRQLAIASQCRHSGNCTH